MEDLLLRARVVVRTSKMKISRRRLADYVKKLHQKACRTCSTIIFFSFNLGSYLFVALSLPLSSFLKLPDFTSWKELEQLRNVQKCRTHVQSVQNYRFLVLNMQMSDVQVAVVVAVV